MDIATNSASQGQNNSTLFVVNSGGSTSTVGSYGTAGVFEITNAHNSESALYVGTNGVQNNNNVGGNAIAARASGGGWALDAEDVSSVGGIGVYGSSTYGLGVYGVTTGGGTAISAFDQSPASNGFYSTAVSGGSYNGNSANFFGGHTSPAGFCVYSGGPGWDCSSDRNLKEHFTEIDPTDVLSKVAALPEWKYQMKRDQPSEWYMGPTAQDFRAAFGLGINDTTINTANAQGVALTAIKGLNLKLDAATAEIADLKRQVADQKAALSEMAGLKASLAALTSRMDNLPPARDVTKASLQRP